MQTDKQTDFANQGDTISRQAAIDALDGNVIVTSRESAQAVMDYIRGCADRIRSLPSAQPELIEKAAYIRGFEQGRTQGMIDTKAEKVTQTNLQPTCNQLVTDTISRQAAIDAIAKLLAERCGGNRIWWKPVAEAVVNNLPSAQPEIIRCKDCKHMITHEGYGYLGEPAYTCDGSMEGWVLPDSFCSRAERRTDERMDV